MPKLKTGLTLRLTRAARYLAARGFTLIELMIVVAIIGILAAIAIPKFSQLVQKSKEGSTKGGLAAVRSALAIYYGDMEGQYPSDDTESLTINSKYLNVIPIARTPNYHLDTSSVGAGLIAAATNDSGGWGYDNNTIDANMGAFWVNCTHTDTKSTIWSAY